MGMGAITWVCLALAVHQGQTPEYHVDARAFEIPIGIDPRRRNDVQELTLYVSRDQGQTWQVVGTKSAADRGGFVYRAANDGTYLFLIQEKDRGGRLSPSDPFRARPSQRTVVDTTRPQIQVTAERLPDGHVRMRWNITETNPDPQSLRLFYRTAEMMPAEPWRPMLPDSPGRNEKSFNPGSAGEVRVRVQIKDRAGNLGQGEAVVAAAVATAPDTGGATIGVIPTTRRSDQPAAPGLLAGRQTPPRPLDNPPAASADAPMPLATPVPRDELNANARTAAVPAPITASPGGATAAPNFPPETPRGALPEVRIVNKRDVKLEFEVAKFGPSGLGGADVYVTVNEGATWERWPGEPSVSLPPITDAHGTTPVRGSVTVQLPREGVIYGFLVAVKSKAGRGREAPKPGEPPEVRIELDTTAPKAEMYEPQADLRQPDTLLLLWNAVDRNLPGTPIALEWAERKEGPWNTIGGEHLPNTLPAGVSPGDRITGGYAWRLPEHSMPSRVYLKLTVIDTAGNRAVALTDKPVLIDLSVPETHVIGAAPASR